MRGKFNRRIAARVRALIALGAAAGILTAANGRARTNYLDGVKDFDELVQRVEDRNQESIKRNKDGAVEFIALGFASDHTLELVSGEQSIREINFIGTQATEPGFAALQKMTNLSSLSVCGGNRRGNSVELASRLSQLRRYNTVQTILKPSDLSYLLRMTNLEELKLPGAWFIGATAISSLTNLPHLKKLMLGGMGDARAEEEITYLRTNSYYAGTNWAAWRKLETSELTTLTNLVSLEELEIYRFSDFGDEQLQRFVAFPNLKSLILEDTRVSGDWRRIVSQFPALTNAEVDGKAWVRKK